MGKNRASNIGNFRANSRHMRIGIDARIYGAKNGGIGRFTEEFVRSLASAKSPHAFVVFLRKSDMSRVRSQKHIEKVCADIQPFTLEEQIFLPHIFRKAKIDLLHIPHHAIARGYKGKKILTVHDLIEYRADRSQATSLPPAVYRFKRAAFQKTFEQALHSADAVVAVSRYVRRDLVKTFPALSSEIPVIHHGAPEIPAKNLAVPVKFPYILYVGSLAPHKNGERLLAAYQHAAEKGGIEEHLVLVTPKDFQFDAWNHMFQHFMPAAHGRIHIVHAASPKRLTQYMTHANLFVSASREEGYGFPAIESLICGTPVLAGFSGALPEISVYFPAGKVLYWDTGNVSLMGKKLADSLYLLPAHFDGASYRKNLPSWDDVAREYVRLYENILEK